MEISFLAIFDEIWLKTLYYIVQCHYSLLLCYMNHAVTINKLKKQTYPPSSEIVEQKWWHVTICYSIRLTLPTTCSMAVSHVLKSQTKPFY